MMSGTDGVGVVMGLVGGTQEEAQDALLEQTE